LSNNGKMNGKRKPLRNLLKNAKINTINVAFGDFFYIKISRKSTKDEAEIIISELQKIFPKNFVFVIPEDLTIEKLNDEELKALGLMRIPEVKDDPTCPKCKSKKKTIKNFNSVKYQMVCLEPECGFQGGWRDRSELQEGDDKKIISQP